jgi:NDP-sugar pyrophosphorylase family protein
MIKALILAGGEGSRLRPWTFSVPKPLLPIGEKPILEIIINRLKKFGFKEFIISLGYRGELIVSYFQYGEKLGIKIDYIRETVPLGTAGPLSLLAGKVKLNPREPILLMNGDILTRINFLEFIKYHKRHNFDLTVMVKKFEMQFPYGILSINNKTIHKVTEKPIYYYDISAGIYLLNCNIIDFIPKGKFFTMPQLIDLLIKKKKKVGAYFSKKQWMAVEEPADIERVNNDLNAWLDEHEL